MAVIRRTTLTRRAEPGMESTKKRPRSWAIPPYWFVVSNRATTTVATTLRALAMRPPTASGPAWKMPLRKDSGPSGPSAPPGADDALRRFGLGIGVDHHTGGRGQRDGVDQGLLGLLPRPPH